MSSSLKNIFIPYKEAPRTKLFQNAMGYPENEWMSITENVPSEAITTYWRYPTSNHMSIAQVTAVKYLMPT